MMLNLMGWRYEVVYIKQIMFHAHGDEDTIEERATLVFKESGWGWRKVDIVNPTFSYFKAHSYWHAVALPWLNSQDWDFDDYTQPVKPKKKKSTRKVTGNVVEFKK